MKLQKALLVVDVQKDFCPGGALVVPEGDKIISVLNKYIKFFAEKKLPIFASRDWHLKKTKHFKKFGGRWPAHCVQTTKGAEFHSKLKLPKEAIIISKGMDPRQDSYSAFQAEDQNGMLFFNLLKIMGVSEIYVGGLAADYCVKSSVIDALKNGFRVKLLTDAVKGVNLKPADSKKAIVEMIARGAEITTLKGERI